MIAIIIVLMFVSIILCGLITMWRASVYFEEEADKNKK